VLHKQELAEMPMDAGCREPEPELGTGCRTLQAGTKPALEAKVEKSLELKKQHEYILYSIYILYICKNKMNMAGTSKRKIIDIREKTFKSLTVMAAMKGTNLKRYIENLLDEVVELHEDEVIYGYLASHRPEGKTQVGKEEKQDFESWLGVKEK
jgi:hypothetical protein